MRQAMSTRATIYAGENWTLYQDLKNNTTRLEIKGPCDLTVYSTEGVTDLIVPAGLLEAVKSGNLILSQEKESREIKPGASVCFVKLAKPDGQAGTQKVGTVRNIKDRQVTVACDDGIYTLPLESVYWISG
jgi:hypothetical protein